jgi:hypothetical protein
LIYVKKRREECVLFLDEGFAAESVAVRLRTAGFTVQRFPEWFLDEDGTVRRNVEALKSFVSATGMAGC